MRRSIALLSFFMAGCSTHPHIDFLDTFFKPKGVCGSAGRQALCVPADSPVIVLPPDTAGAPAPVGP